MVGSVVKLIFVNTLIMYWSCYKEDKNRGKITAIFCLMYSCFNGLGTINAEEHYTISMISCLIEVYFIRILICHFLAKQGFQLWIKQIFYNYVFFGITCVVEYIVSFFFKDYNVAFSNMWSLFFDVDTYLTVVIGLLVIYSLIRFGLFEVMPYKIVRNLVIGLTSFEFVYSVLLIFQAIPKEVQIELFIVGSYIISMLACGMIWYLKRKTEQDNEIYKNIIEKEYYTYEKIYRQQLAIKNIRHNLANHMEIIKNLSQKDKVEEQKKYEKELIQCYNTYFDVDKVLDSKDSVPDGKSSVESASVLKNQSFVIKIIYGGLFVVGCCGCIWGFQMYSKNVFQWIAIVVGLLLISVCTYYIIINKLESNYGNDIKQLVNRGKDEEEKWNQIKSWIESSVVKDKAQDASLREKELANLVKVANKKYTTNEIVDVMLNCKEKKCREMNIQTEWNIVIPPLTNISQVDIVEVLSNLIDNAIEACVRVGESDSQKLMFIHIDANIRANFWTVAIENSKLEEEKPIKNHFKTKKTGEHGLGMKIIKSIVERYDGVLKYSDNNDSFRTEFMIEI